MKSEQITSDQSIVHYYCTVYTGSPSLKSRLAARPALDISQHDTTARITIKVGNANAKIRSNTAAHVESPALIPKNSNNPTIVPRIKDKMKIRTQNFLCSQNGRSSAPSSSSSSPAAATAAAACWACTWVFPVRNRARRARVCSPITRSGWRSSVSVLAYSPLQISQWRSACSRTQSLRHFM